VAGYSNIKQTMKTTQPSNKLDFNNWARFIKAEANRMKYGYRPKTMKVSPTTV